MMTMRIKLWGAVRAFVREWLRFNRLTAEEHMAGYHVAKSLRDMQRLDTLQRLAVLPTAPMNLPMPKVLPTLGSRTGRFSPEERLMDKLSIEPGTKVRHNGRGTTYMCLGLASIDLSAGVLQDMHRIRIVREINPTTKLQQWGVYPPLANPPDSLYALGYGLMQTAKPVTHGTLCVIYRHVNPDAPGYDSASYWARPVEEWTQERFTQI